MLAELQHHSRLGGIDLRSDALHLWAFTKELTSILCSRAGEGFAGSPIWTRPQV
jgi:hypothetical protein